MNGSPNPADPPTRCRYSGGPGVPHIPNRSSKRSCRVVKNIGRNLGQRMKPRLRWTRQPGSKLRQVQVQSSASGPRSSVKPPGLDQQTPVMAKNSRHSNVWVDPVDFTQPFDQRPQAINAALDTRNRRSSSDGLPDTGTTRIDYPDPSGDKVRQCRHSRQASGDVPFQGAINAQPAPGLDD